jgi:hypothetical protein
MDYPVMEGCRYARWFLSPTVPWVVSERGGTINGYHSVYVPFSLTGP